MKKILIYRNLFFLTLISVFIGVLARLINSLFAHVLFFITDFRIKHIYLLIPFLGIIGVIIVRCYQKYGGRSNKGMALIFEAGHEINDEIPLRLIPFSMITTWLIHLFGGSAGRVGVAIQIGGTIGNGIGRYIKIENCKKILLLAGMAAGFGGLFRTPIAAAFFALEVLTVGVL